MKTIKLAMVVVGLVAFVLLAGNWWLKQSYGWYLPKLCFASSYFASAALISLAFPKRFFGEYNQWTMQWSEPQLSRKDRTITIGAAVFAFAPAWAICQLMGLYW
ncbi:MAG: hypothetical protein U0996_05275 [Planctomycetaceae bacterium]